MFRHLKIKGSRQSSLNPRTNRYYFTAWKVEDEKQLAKCKTLTMDFPKYYLEIFVVGRKFLINDLCFKVSSIHDEHPAGYEDDKYYHVDVTFKRIGWLEYMWS